MKKTLSTYEAAGILRRDENANWSSAGALALVEYLEEHELEADEEIELDIVAIRCDFSEYESLQEWSFEFFGGQSDQFDWTQDGEEIDEEIREYIRECGQLIEFDGGVIVNSF